jgi:hypothetical protein
MHNLHVLFVLFGYLDICFQQHSLRYLTLTVLTLDVLSNFIYVRLAFTFWDVTIRELTTDRLLTLYLTTVKSLYCF